MRIDPQEMAWRVSSFAPFLWTLCAGLVFGGTSSADVMSDTWVATDGLGRKLPTAAEIGGPRADRTVALFYFLWHDRAVGTPGPFDVTKILAQDPVAIEKDSPLWGPMYAPHYWGEPLFGYYSSKDPAVLRKHAQMLSDAGVDLVVFDLSNGVNYDGAWTALLDVFAQVRADGGATPQVSFLCPFAPSPSADRRGSSVRRLWKSLYSKNIHPELWYRREGKPLLMAHPTYADPPPFASGNTHGPGRFPQRIEPGHPVGQYVTLDRAAASVGISTPTYGSHTGCAVTLAVRQDGPAGPAVAAKRFTDILDNETLMLRFEKPLPPGNYYLELSDPAVSVGWWSRRSADANGVGGGALDGKRVEALRAYAWYPYEEDDSAERIRNFFTFRRPLPGYHRKDPLKGGWVWLETYPQHMYQDFDGKDEMMAVGVAQNAKPDRKCPMSEPGAMGRRWHDGANDPDPRQLARGPNFQEQWDHAHAADPRFIFVTGWNEWWASRFPEWAGWKKPGGVFPDQYDAEHSRDCEPVKGHWGDAYYWQLVSNIRRYKGVREIPPVRSAPIAIDGAFADWQSVSPEFRDTPHDEMRRDCDGVAKAGRYIDRSGRNDIVAAKVARDATGVSFYVRVREPLQKGDVANWMLLFIDADCDVRTGWLGYDMTVQPGAPPAGVTVAVGARGLELRIPAARFPNGRIPNQLDFKWADNCLVARDWSDFTLHGDAAPNDRYSYRARFLDQTPP